MLKRAIARGFEAGSREDYAVGLLFYEPDVELRALGEASRVLGLPESYSGHQGFIDFWGDVTRDMDDFSSRPEEVIDLGDRVAVRIALGGRGRTSGAVSTQTAGSIYHFSPRGMVARQDLYWTGEEVLDALNDHGELLRAAGPSD